MKTRLFGERDSGGKKRRKKKRIISQRRAIKNGGEWGGEGARLARRGNF